MKIECALNEVVPNVSGGLNFRYLETGWQNVDKTIKQNNDKTLIYNELSLFPCGAEGGRTIAMCVFRNSHKIKANRLCCNPLQREISQIPSYKLQEIAPNCKQVDENCNYCQPIYYICSAIWKL